MAAKQEEKKQAEKPDHSEQDSIIGVRVLKALGQPRDLQQVQVRRLWDDHYRVNVFTGTDTASARVAHSYFLVVDSEKNITTCNPQIKKVY